MMSLNSYHFVVRGSCWVGKSPYHSQPITMTNQQSTSKQIEISPIVKKAAEIARQMSENQHLLRDAVKERRASYEDLQMKNHSPKKALKISEKK